MADLARTGGGTALAAAGLPRLVTLPSGQTYRVRPPTVRDAIEILESLPGVVAGDAGDVQVLEDALTRWLPNEVLAWLLVLEAVALDRTLKGLLFQGVDLTRMQSRARAAKNPDDQKGERPTDWRLALSDYCQIYHAGNPWVVYQVTPWPFFLSLLEVSGAASARELIRWVELEVLPHLGKAATGALHRLKERAEDRGRDGDGYGTHAPPEVISRDREALRAQFGKGAVQ